MSPLAPAHNTATGLPPRHSAGSPAAATRTEAAKPARAAFLAAALLAPLAPAMAYQSFEAEAAAQLRWHPQVESRAEQESTDASLSLQAEWYWESEDRNHSLTITPFGRYAPQADSRSHADLRELYWNGIFGDLELRLGISKVFWGNTEFLHLVDIINQDDTLENLDGEDKLGQPMLRASYRVPNGSLIGFVLPYFREREFLGPEARLSTPLPVDEDNPLYESEDEETHVDWALRWQGYFGGLDFGLAHFSGTARDPLLLPAGFTQEGRPTQLVPAYPLLEQSSLDAQYTTGGWLFKLEALYADTAVVALQPGTPPRFVDTTYAAATGGFEYTLYGIRGSAADLGLLAEYLWDERGAQANTPFQDDLFIGGRLALNDVAGSTLLGGAVLDLDHGGAFINVEASRRLSGELALALEARLFTDVDPRDTTLFPVRNDDYLQLELTRYF